MANRLDVAGEHDSVKLVTKSEEDDLLAVIRLASLLTHPHNWDLGDLKQSKLLSPEWEEGGFLVSQLPTAHKLYRNIRESTDCRPMFSLLVNILLKRSDFRLRHYAFSLIYRVLERQYLLAQDGGPACADMSMKELLSPTDHCLVFGAIYPYFDPIRMLSERLEEIVVLRHAKRRVVKFITSMPSWTVYLCVVTVGIIGFYIDLIKDILIAIDVSFLYTDIRDFKSILVILLWLTTFLR